MNHIIDINIYYIAYILFSLLSNLFKQFQILSTLIILNYKTITKGIIKWHNESQRYVHMYK